MNSHYLQEFLILAQELNYSAAAQRSYVARATLVEHMSDLEKELNCTLFCKENGKLTLTPIGRRFVTSAEELLGRMTTLVEEYRALASNFLTVRVAATNLPWLESRLRRARRQIQVVHPEKQIEVASVPGAASTIEALRNGSNDIVVAGKKRWNQAVVEEPQWGEGIEGFLLQTESIAFLITEGHPLFKLDSIRVKDLDGACMLLPPDIYDAYVRDGVAEKLRSKGASVEVRSMSFGDHFEYFASDFDDVLGIVPETLIPRFGLDVREDCKVFYLEDFPVMSDFYVLYKTDFLQDSNACLLIDELKQMS